MATLAEIEALTRKYAGHRETLGAHLRGLDDALRAEKRERLPSIKRALNATAAAESDLRAAIADSPGCFEKPRTQVFHGVKVGFQKGKGKVEYDDADRVVALIRKHLPEQAVLLVKVTETPVKKTLAELPAADLKRLGVTVEDSGDQV